MLEEFELQMLRDELDAALEDDGPAISYPESGDVPDAK